MFSVLIVEQKESDLNGKIGTREIVQPCEDKCLTSLQFLQPKLFFFNVMVPYAQKVATAIFEKFC